MENSYLLSQSGTVVGLLNGIVSNPVCLLPSQCQVL